MHFKPANTLHSILVSPKDKVPQGKCCGTVFHLHCQDCNSCYVSETAHTLDTRVAEIPIQQLQFSGWRAPESRSQYWGANIGQGNGLVPNGRKRLPTLGHTRVISTVTRVGIDLLEFTPLYSVRDRHIFYVTLPRFLTKRASISPVLPKSDQEAVVRFESSKVSKLMHPSKETLNSPSSRVDADSTSRRRRILRCIFSGVGESWPN